MYGWSEHYIGVDEDGEAWTMRVHQRSQCAPRPCPLHKPSDHPLHRANIAFRNVEPATLVWRICKHRIPHPDPDSVAYLNATGQTDAVVPHACCPDRCCDE